MSSSAASSSSSYSFDRYLAMTQQQEEEREKKVDIYRQYCPFDTINYNYYISKDHLLPWPRIIIPAIVCPQIVAQQQSVYRVAKKNCKATARQEKGITALKGNCPARRTKGGKILTSDNFLNIAGES